MTDSPKPRIALITGASHGIGRSVAQRLARDGFRLITLDRDRPAQCLAEERFIQLDLTDGHALDAVLCDIRERHPAISTLVNNAGLVRLNPAGAVTVDDMRASMALNVEVPLKIMQALLDGMKTAGHGRIIHISSRAVLGKELRTAYGASKAALIGMTRTWALELAQYGITVNCIGPGPIATDLFMKNNPPDKPNTKKLLAQLPMGRMGTPQEVAHLVASLAHEDAGFITGQIVYVCGGLSVGLAPI